MAGTINLVTEIADARQALTGFTYDPNGNLLSVNGEANGSNRISSATLIRNGVQVAGPNDFNQNVEK